MITLSQMDGEESRRMLGRLGCVPRYLVELQTTLLVGWPPTIQHPDTSVFELAKEGFCDGAISAEYRLGDRTAVLTIGGSLLWSIELDADE